MRSTLNITRVGSSQTELDCICFEATHLAPVMILEKTTVKMGMEALTVCAYDTSVFQMEMWAHTDDMNLKAARLTTYFR